MQEPKYITVSDFTGGYTPDYGSLVELPSWKKLYNCWLDSQKQLRGRPHLKHAAFDGIAGIGITHDKKLVVVSNGTVYIDSIPVAGISGVSRLSFDYQINRTIISTGGKPVLWDGTTSTVIQRDNVFALATMGGAYKSRLYAVDTTDKKRIWASEALDPTDFAESFLTDPRAIADDKKSTGGKFYGFSHDIIDIKEQEGKLIIFTEKAIYSLTDAIEQNAENMAYFPSLVMEVSIDVYTAKMAKMTKGILFPNSTGVYAYPTVERIPMVGIERTIRKLLANAKCHISLDPVRRLIYLVTDDDNPTTFVFHVDFQVWTLWDIGIKDLVVIDDTIYIHATDDVLYTLEDNSFDGLIPYDITIQSGLASFGNASVRKRFKTLAIEINSEEKLDYFLDIATENIDLDTVGMNELLQGTDRIDCYVGVQGERGSISMIFTNYGEFRLSNAIVNYLEKIPRMPMGISPL
jgi:outer membrane protein assembly factor BamB